MKKTLVSIIVAIVAVFGGAWWFGSATYAEENESADGSSEEQTSEAAKMATSISVTPVSRIMQLKSGEVYDNNFSINNDGSRELAVEIFAAPYSYVYSEDTDSYQLGFSNENNYTQIVRWITFKGKDGNYAKTANFTVAPGESKQIDFRVTTPSNLPDGGQYAVIFARTTNGVASANGIRTEASPGMVLYGRSTDGETITKAEISNLSIRQSITEDNVTRNTIGASAKVKNSGNMDFNAKGTLVVDGIIGGGHYETPATAGRTSVIPEAELVVSDEWRETPGFGIFKVKWTVEAGGETETIEQIVVINIIPVIIIIIILLTIVVVWCIIRGKKRKERRSRLSV